MAFIKAILFLCLFALMVRAKPNGIFGKCEKRWCQQKGVYFGQYTYCESVTNAGKTCNNPQYIY